MTKRCVIYCISFTLAVLVLLVCFVACYSTPVEAAEPDPGMFTMVERQRLSSDESIKVFVHNETGVMYFFYSGYRRGGLTIMVDADGKPLIYTPEEVQQ